MTTHQQEEPLLSVREGLDLIMLIYLLFCMYNMAKGENDE